MLPFLDIITDNLTHKLLMYLLILLLFVTILLFYSEQKFNRTMNYS